MAKLEDKCWIREIIVPEDGSKLEVVERRVKRVCAEEVALSEWERKYGLRPNVVVARVQRWKVIY